MNSIAATGPTTRWTDDAMRSRLRRRYRSERIFRLIGLGAVGLSLAFLAFLLVTMLYRGLGGLSLDFLRNSDSTDPAMAGVWGALKGSFLTIVVTMALAFPVGVLSAVYLEEFASRNRWTDMIEVSINNLAAVPSIIFGLLGLAVFLNLMNLPRSAPLVGGLTLALMTMPVIVIAGRNAITSVPPSIREAALGVGASKMQVVFHHVLPLALPGILTGTIIGMARALGETAPLLMIGMRAFIAVPPSGIADPSSVLPVQIFLWSDEVDRAFVEKTSAAIIVLLVFMLMMNGLAIYLRNRFERRW
jgi:phosphate transport system permease protein